MNEKQTFWHNGARITVGEIQEPNGLKPGDRFRVIGEFPLGRFDWAPLSQEWIDYVTNGKSIDTWALVDRNFGIELNHVPVILQSVNGREERVNISNEEFKQLTERGMQVEQKRKALETALAAHCRNNQLTPVYAPSVVQDLYNNNKIAVGQPLTIDGVSRGTVVELAIEGGHIVITTDKCMATTINLTNAYRQAELEIQKYINEPQNTSSIDEAQLKEFIAKNRATFENVTGGRYIFINDIERCSDLMKELNIIASNYIGSNNLAAINLLDHTNSETLSMLFASRLIEHGIVDQPLPRPTEHELKYLQGLGYTEEDMSKKSEILKNWLADKQLTKQETVAAMSIIENKVLNVVKEIAPGSAKERKSFLGIEVNVPADTLTDVFMHGGTVHGTSINLATGEISYGKIQIPECAPDTKYLNAPDLLMRTEDAMWTTIDASEAYHSFGGFDYQLALEMSQNGGKGQKVDSISIDSQEATQEENTMINHFDLIDRGR